MGNQVQLTLLLPLGGADRQEQSTSQFHQNEERQRHSLIEGFPVATLGPGHLSFLRGNHLGSPPSAAMTTELKNLSGCF